MNNDYTNSLSINQIVDDFMYAYASNILDSDHNSSGSLIMNMNKRIKWDGRYFSVSISLPKHWKYLEYGTKPHFPPVKAILKWITVKPVLPRPYNGKLPTDKQLAYMIARKISIDGTPATNLLHKTMTEFDIVGKIYNEFCNIYQQQIQQDINI